MQRITAELANFLLGSLQIYLGLVLGALSQLQVLFGQCPMGEEHLCASMPCWPRLHQSALFDSHRPRLLDRCWK